MDIVEFITIDKRAHCRVRNDSNEFIHNKLSIEKRNKWKKSLSRDSSRQNYSLFSNKLFTSRVYLNFSLLFFLSLLTSWYIVQFYHISLYYYRWSTCYKKVWESIWKTCCIICFFNWVIIIFHPWKLLHMLILIFLSS